MQTLPRISTHRLLPLTLAAPLLTAAASACFAASPLKPGLWQFQVETSVNGAPAQNLSEMLARVPPSVRAAMEEQLKARGLSVDGQGLKICLSPQVAALDHPPLHLDGQCRENWAKHGESRWNFSFQCTDPTSSGEGHIDLVGQTQYTTDYTAQVTQAPGAPRQTVHSISTAHWLAADCGDVPALALPGRQ